MSDSTITLNLTAEQLDKLRGHAEHEGDESAEAAIIRMIDKLPIGAISRLWAFTGAPSGGWSDI